MSHEQRAINAQHKTEIEQLLNRRWNQEHLISVIISTRNRAVSLKECLNALARVETEIRWEIVVVDNGSIDETHDLLLSLPEKIGGAPVTIGSQPIAGLARARNTGVSLASGDILAFTDDDCYVAKDYVTQIARIFERPTIAVMGGRILPFDPKDAYIGFKEHPHYIWFNSYSFVRCGDFQGSNMVFRRSVLEAVGGFSENLGPGTPFNCEDIDAVARVLWAGHEGCYSPTVIVYHHHKRQHPKEVRAIKRSYSCGRGAFMVKFIKRPDSRWRFARGWAKWLLSEVLGATRAAITLKRPNLQFITEIKGAIRFAAKK